MIHVQRPPASLKRRFPRAFAAFIGLTLLAGMAQAESAAVSVAVVSDGDSTLIRETQAALANGLAELSDFELEFRLPPEKQTTHAWDVEVARQALEEALADPSVDVVVALDILSSSIASSLQPAKPLIAGAIVDPQLQGFVVTDAGTSGTPNLHFLTSRFDLAGAIEAFQGSTDAERVGLLVDGSLFDAIPALRKTAGAVLSGLSSVYLVEASPDEVDVWLGALTGEIDALFITPLPQLTEGQVAQILHHARQQRWPTFSALGRPQVEAGALMGQSLVVKPEELARRLAIDIRDIALGRPASDLSVGIEVRDRLVINRATAEAIDFQPSFELLFAADIVNEELPEGRVLSLRSAIAEARQRNLQLAISEADLEIAQQDTRVARGALLPQLIGDAGWTRQDRDLAGVNPTRTADVGLTLTQSIYSETLRSNYRATAWAEEAEVADREAVALDVTETAALAYLRVLVAKTERDIQIENLNLTRANLDRARLRYDVGATNRSEIFRFEAELGTDRQNVSSALAAYERQRFELNRVLRQPIEQAFQTEEPGIDPSQIFGDERLTWFLHGPERLDVLAGFLAEEALRNAPELAAIRSQIEAQKRLQKAAERRRYVPTVDAFSTASRIVDDGGALVETDFDEDWSVGIEVTWPLFEGGSIRSQTRRAGLQVEQLELTLAQAADSIEANVRGSLAQAAASRLNIGFAEASAEAARQTLDLVTDAYVRGSAGYIDLIDAQNTYLNARLAAANAVYQHLQDLVTLQRAVAFFDVAVSPEEREIWLHRLDRFHRPEEDPRP